MNLQPLDENTLLGYIAFQFPQISLQEQQEKIKKISENLASERLIPEQYLLFVDENKVCGLLRWHFQNRGDQKILETLGSPSISLDSKKPEAIELAIETLVTIAARESAVLKLTFDEAQFGNIPDHLVPKFNLALTFQSQGYGRDLRNLEPGKSVLTLENFGAEENDLQQAANLLEKIQANSFDPTASEDLDDPLAVLEERIAQGERLAATGGAAENYLVAYQGQHVGLLLPRYSHPLEKRGGMFLGLIPETRGQGLGCELHYLGLTRLKEMGVAYYWGETFEGNSPMKRIFLTNGCSVIPGANYWEYMTKLERV